MKTLKISTILVSLVITFIAVSKNEKPTIEPTVNLENVEVVQMLSAQEMGQRPSPKVHFYVETELIKKSRGFSTVNANIYVMDRVTGASNLLANQHIIVQSYQDAMLDFNIPSNNFPKTKLPNGDELLNSNSQTNHEFNELIKYEAIYNSYIIATNKLLNLDREI